MRGFHSIIVVGVLAANAFAQLPTTPAIQHPVSPPRQVRIEARLIEVDRAKLKAAGIDLSAIRKTAQRNRNPQHAEAPGQESEAALLTGRDGAALLAVDLERRRLCRTLAAPVLTTAPGRPAQFEFGDDAMLAKMLTSSAIAPGFAGAKVTAMPRVMRDGKIRMEVNLQVRSLDPTKTTQWEGRNVPTVHTETVDTAFYMTTGETVLLAAGQKVVLQEASKKKKNETEQSVELMALFKVDVYEPTLAMPPRPVNSRR